jgi:hypothetical protein
MSENIDKQKLIMWADEEIEYWRSCQGEEVDAAIIALKDLKLEIASGRLDKGKDEHG